MTEVFSVRLKKTKRKEKKRKEKKNLKDRKWLVLRCGATDATFRQRLRDMARI